MLRLGTIILPRLNFASNEIFCSLGLNYDDGLIDGGAFDYSAGINNVI